MDKHECFHLFRFLTQIIYRFIYSILFQSKKHTRIHICIYAYMYDLFRYSLITVVSVFPTSQFPAYMFLNSLFVLLFFFFFFKLYVWFQSLCSFSGFSSLNAAFPSRYLSNASLFSWKGLLPKSLIISSRVMNSFLSNS